MVDKTYTRTVPTQPRTTVTTPEGTPAITDAARQRCENRGGTWNAATRTCVLPERKGVGAGGSIDTEEKQRAVGQVTDTETQKNKVLAGVETSAAQGVARKEEEFRIKQERERLIREESPIKRELDPTLGKGVTGRTDEFFGGEAFPVVGPLATILGGKLKRVGFGSPIPGAGISLGDLDLNKEKDFVLQPEELKNEALTLIEKNEIEKGLTRSERFGEFVEAVPAGELGKYIPGFADAEKPSGNVQTLLRGIRIMKTTSTDAERKARDGTWTQAYANEVVDSVDAELQSAESRIKLLIQNSPELKFNSDGVNFIEQKILEARRRSFDAKLNILEGETTDPLEMQVLNSLRDSIQEEDFSIPGL